MDVGRVVPPSNELGESPLWPAAALLAAALLYADLPSRFIAGSGGSAFQASRWIVPALTVLVLVSLAAVRPRWRVTRRHLVLGTIALVSLANAASIILLIHFVLNGATASRSAPELIRAAIHMWAVNVLLFGLWYWQLDGGGPIARPSCPPARRDFLFPQQAETVFAGWRPLFIDYLYVSFTNASAFSPTDTMPLSRWAKMLMLIQSAISLALAVMVVARAVNILK